MKYGYFDDKNREYVITRPDTPLPWINYLGCQAYYGIISNTAGGYSFYRDARLRRITRSRYNNVPFDNGGRFNYLRDNQDGEYWSPSWMPTCRDLEQYTCRHGMGYSIIGSKYHGISASTRYFVPLDENLEIWQLTLTNNRLAPASLSIFSSIEFCLWDAQDDSTNFQRNFSIGQVELDDEVIYHKTEYRERRDHFAWFACSDHLAGYDTQRETFLGPYRGWDRPAAVERGESFDSEAHGWAPIGSHHVRLVLQPGETHQVVFALGYHENPTDKKFDPPDSQTVNKSTVKPVIARYRDKANVDAAFDKLRSYWDGLLGICQVRTPDVHTDRMVNVWNAYQCMATFNMSRSASFFESGIGRGLGFRDSNQDLLGFVQMIPERARERILDLAATQLPDGGAYHQLLGWSPKDDREFLTLDEFIAAFTLEGVNRANAVVNFTEEDPFDPKAIWLNAEHIRALPVDELTHNLQPFFEQAGLHPSSEKLLAVTPLIRERIKLLRDAVSAADFFFLPQLAPSDPAELIPPTGDAAMARRVLQYTQE